MSERRRLRLSAALLLASGAALPSIPAHAATVAPSNLTYSTYFGGSGDDMGYMVAGASDGGAYVTGYLGTSSGMRSYVVYYKADGTIGWDTPIGGNGSVDGYYIRANSTAIYVVGVTKATDLPHATNTDPAGGSATAFMTVVNPSTGTVVSSTYLGGAGFSAGNVDAIDPVTGEVYAALSTGSQTEVLLLDPTATHVVWKRFLGGTAYSTHPYGMQTDSSGDVVVATLTNSPKYPTLNAQQSTYSGGLDTGITKYNSQGTILWSTYLGGSAEDRPNGVDIDPSGNVYVAGRTWSSNFPLTNAQESTNPDNAGYVASYTSAGQLRYSTYVGGVGADWFGGVSVAADGTAWVMGGTGSSNLPVVGGASYVRKNGGYAYVAAVKPDDSGMSFATYLGGSGSDGASGGILVSGGFWVIGRTTSKDFPTVNPAQATDAGGFDAFVSFLKTS